jgi:hypothetical protein
MVLAVSRQTLIPAHDEACPLFVVFYPAAVELREYFEFPVTRLRTLQYRLPVLFSYFR